MLRRRLGMEKDENESDAAERTGIFTSGIVSTAQKQTIALFFTGRQHAGENLADVLRRRAAELAPPMQMCDALSRNLPKLPEKLEVIVGHCLAHARRRFVEVIANFPEQCQHVLEQPGKIYGNDALVHKQAMTPHERFALAPAQERSGDERTSCLAHHSVRGEECRTELGPGIAMRYLPKHWERLTLFLRQPGAVQPGGSGGITFVYKETIQACFAKSRGSVIRVIAKRDLRDPTLRTKARQIQAVMLSNRAPGQGGAQ
jgi:transposase